MDECNFVELDDFCSRYGEVFKTNILGCPSVMLASPDAARFVLVTKANLFKPTYPRCKEVLIGPSALFFHQGDYHMRLRKLVQSSLYPEAIRNLVNDVEAIAIPTLESVAGGHVLNTFDEMKRVGISVNLNDRFLGGLEKIDFLFSSALLLSLFLIKLLMIELSSTHSKWAFSLFLVIWKPHVKKH